MTALVGPSGGGKSTAAKLAARFWDADDGVVSIGGVDVSTVDPEALLVDFAKCSRMWFCSTTRSCRTSDSVARCHG